MTVALSYTTKVIETTEGALRLADCGRYRLFSLLGWNPVTACYHVNEPMRWHTVTTNQALRFMRELEKGRDYRRANVRYCDPTEVDRLLRRATGG